MTVVKGWQTYPQLFRGQVSDFMTAEPGRLSLQSTSNHLGEAKPGCQGTAEPAYKHSLVESLFDAAHDRGRSCDLERTVNAN